MRVQKITFYISIVLIVLSCKPKIHLKDYTLRGFIFGTSYKITYLNAENNYQKSIDSLFFSINKSLSTYIPTSDISRINRGDTTVLVDDYFIEVFNKSKRIFKETNGYFDPTVGNLVNAWGFGPKKEKNDLSEREVIQQMRFVGFQKVKLQGRKVKKESDSIYLDFNSIAKGFAIDVIGRFLESENIESYLVEIGGEIRTRGKKENASPWVIKLVNPLHKNELDRFKKLNLSNKSMATSGNYRKFRIADNGEKYVHTINPKTGYALESNLLSASVISNLDCADVDAYATSFMAMGLEKSRKFLENHKNLHAILLFSNKEGLLEEYIINTYK